MRVGALSVLRQHLGEHPPGVVESLLVQQRDTEIKLRAYIFWLQFQHTFKLSFCLRVLLSAEVGLSERRVRLDQVWLLLDDGLQLRDLPIGVVRRGRGESPHDLHGPATPALHSQRRASHSKRDYR